MPDAEADVAAVVQLINGMPQRTAAIDQLKLEFVGRYGRPLEVRGTGGLVRRLRKNYAHVLRVVKGEQCLSSTDQRVLSRRQWAARGRAAGPCFAGDLSGKLYLSTVMDGPALHPEPVALSGTETATVDERSDLSELESLRRRYVPQNRTHMAMAQCFFATSSGVHFSRPKTGHCALGAPMAAGVSTIIGVGCCCRRWLLWAFDTDAQRSATFVLHLQLNVNVVHDVTLRSGIEPCSTRFVRRLSQSASACPHGHGLSA